jgi:hypothetical protein
MNVERIVWVDSGFYITDEWKPVVEALSKFKYDDMKVLTAGFVVYEDDNVVAISHSVSESTESTFGLQLIAKSNILKREVLLHAKD